MANIDAPKDTLIFDLIEHEGFILFMDELLKLRAEYEAIILDPKIENNYSRNEVKYTEYDLYRKIRGILNDLINTPILALKTMAVYSQEDNNNLKKANKGIDKVQEILGISKE